MSLRRWALPATLAVALLAGCAGPAQRPTPPQAAELAAQAERERMLEAQIRWQLEGRVAVRQGGDGGSGQLDWAVDGRDLLVALRAPVSGQGWRLQVTADGARLEGLEGGPRQDSDADRLLRESVGWDVPLDLFSRWVRGLRGSPDAQLELDPAGLPERITEAGWVVEYRGWDSSLDPPLPRRIEAESGEQRVRLLVRRWQVGDGE